MRLEMSRWTCSLANYCNYGWQSCCQSKYINDLVPWNVIRWLFITKKYKLDTTVSRQPRFTKYNCNRYQYGDNRLLLSILLTANPCSRLSRLGDLRLIIGAHMCVFRCSHSRPHRHARSLIQVHSPIRAHSHARTYTHTYCKSYKWAIWMWRRECKRRYGPSKFLWTRFVFKSRGLSRICCRGVRRWL